jgi:AcrR family transcriptional regulator
MVRPKRTEQIDLRQAIKEAAWQQIAEEGAPALSLRAIARQLGITAPAIYNYYPRRDDLVTALIVDAFTSLGNSQKEALDALPEGALGELLVALGIAYRLWAVAYPQRYQLIFGTPIPGYHAPADITLPAAAWALTPLIHTLQATFQAGRLKIEELEPLTPELQSMLEAWQQFEGGDNIEVLYLALVIWSRVHGLASMEIGQQMPSFITDPAEVFCREVAHIRNQYFS